MGLIGSLEWCCVAEDLFKWLEGVGKLIQQWLNGTVKPDEWAQAVRDAMPPGTDDSYIAQFLRWVGGFTAEIVQLAGRGILTMADMIRCASYYGKLLTNIQRPEAYVTLLFVRNAISWIRETKIGSQSYLGFTVATYLQFPQLEAYVDTLLNYLCCTETPHVPDIAEAWLKGYISDEYRDCLLRLQGHEPHTWDTFIRSRGENLTPHEAIQFARRNGATYLQQIEALRTVGVVDTRNAAAMLKLYDELPTIQDHLHWLKKNVFNDEYVKQYRLEEGFIDRFWKAFGSDLTALGYTQERARLEYCAHWNMPSPTEMRQFIYRLRPGRVPKDRQFTKDDYKRILQEQDYNPLAQQWLADTANPVPALTYLRDMHRLDLLTDAEMQAYHGDLGYEEKESELFVKVDTIRKRRMRATQGSGWNPAAIRKAYGINQLTEDQVREKMTYQGYSQQDATDLMERAKSDVSYTVLVRARSRLLTTSIANVRQGIRVGTIDQQAASDALVKIGWQKQQADGIAALEMAAANTNRVAEAVRHLRSAFLRGEVDAQYSRVALQRIGIVAEATDSYLATWNLELTPFRKRRTASQIVKDIAEGLMPLDEATARLTNLGYEDTDRMLFLADAQRLVINTEASRAAARELGERGRDGQLNQLLGTVDGLSKRLIGELKREASPAKLQKWVAAGLISKDEFYQRMDLYGIHKDKVDLWYAEACMKKGAKCAKEDNAAEANGEAADGEAIP